MPTTSTHSPEPSYMPQVVMTLRIRSTSGSATARSLVTGLSPPLARVAAMTATSRQSTATEH